MNAQQVCGNASRPSPELRLDGKVMEKIGEVTTPEGKTAVGNFLKAGDVGNFDLALPMEKPLAIEPPATLGEARRSPWWPQYKAAMGVELDGHAENKTWTVVPRSTMPRGTNLIRGKWVFDDRKRKNC